MNTFISRSFGGLSRPYYFRHLFFGLLIACVLFWMKTVTHSPTPLLIAWLGVNTLLYPYSRFVWERIVGFIFGDNVFIVPIIILFPIKLATMMVCWQMAILIAPLGLAYLYWHHSREARIAPGYD